MAKHKTCPSCGAALDFGERCDCQQKAAPSPGTDAALGGLAEIDAAAHREECFALCY